MGLRCRQVIHELKARADPAAVQGMGRYGIATTRTLGGSSVPYLRSLAKRIGTSHLLAAQLWSSGIHEARILAAVVDDPAAVTEGQMETGASDFDSWDVVDHCCGGLFDRTGAAYRKAVEWSGRNEEYVKRAGFVLMASLAVHDKAAPDRVLAAFLPLIEREAVGARNYVRKAVNWALRQVGKRSVMLNEMAIESAERILRQAPASAPWVASDALRELRGDAVQARLRAHGQRAKALASGGAPGVTD